MESRSAANAEATCKRRSDSSHWAGRERPDQNPADRGRVCCLSGKPACRCGSSSHRRRRAVHGPSAKPTLTGPRSRAPRLAWPC